MTLRIKITSVYIVRKSYTYNEIRRTSFLIGDGVLVLLDDIKKDFRNIKTESVNRGIRGTSTENVCQTRSLSNRKKKKVILNNFLGERG